VATAVSASTLAAREAMIDSQLKPCGVVSPRLSAAFYAVAREDYVAPGRRGLAYVDAPQPLKPGREMLAPLSLGLLLQRADVQAADSVLVVGAGTGYAAALVARLAGRVVALEADADLAAVARTNLSGMAGVTVVEGPLADGHAAGQPYSMILIDGAVEQLPPELIAQLAEGGRLLAIVIGSDGVSRAAIGHKRAGLLPLEPFAEAAGALLPSFGKAPAFQF
jgi:protein-L-isoaspartate(D-aspartate) O-methyltransferase